MGAQVRSYSMTVRDTARPAPEVVDSRGPAGEATRRREENIQRRPVATRNPCARVPARGTSVPAHRSPQSDTAGAVLEARVRGLAIVMGADRGLAVPQASPEADQTYPPGNARLARAGAGFEAQPCQLLHRDSPQATAPAGQTRFSWTPPLDNRENPVMKVQGSPQACSAAPPARPVSARRRVSPAARSPSGLSRQSRGSSRPGTGTPQRRFTQHRPVAPGLKGRGGVGCGVHACTARATSASDG
jgi:hypothetical protein